MLDLLCYKNNFDNSLCPTCKKELGRQPKRKTTCPYCKNLIFYRNDCYTGYELLVNDEQAKLYSFYKTSLCKLQVSESGIRNTLINSVSHIDPYSLSDIDYLKLSPLNDCILYMKKKHEANLLTSFKAGNMIHYTYSLMTLGYISVYLKEYATAFNYFANHYYLIVNGVDYNMQKGNLTIQKRDNECQYISYEPLISSFFLLTQKTVNINDFYDYFTSISINKKIKYNYSLHQVFDFIKPRVLYFIELMSE